MKIKSLQRVQEVDSMLLGSPSSSGSLILGRKGAGDRAGRALKGSAALADLGQGALPELHAKLVWSPAAPELSGVFGLDVVQGW